MAGSKTTYLQNALLNHVLRHVALTSPTTVYVALFTAITDGEAGTVTEVSGNAYARQAATFGAPDATSTVSNSANVVFPTATPAGWGTVVGFGVYDALTVGNLLYYGTLGTSKTISAGDVAEFLTGQLTIQEG